MCKANFTVHCQWESVKPGAFRTAPKRRSCRDQSVENLIDHPNEIKQFCEVSTLSTPRPSVHSVPGDRNGRSHKEWPVKPKMFQSLAPCAPFAGAFQEMKTLVWKFIPSNFTVSSCTQGMESVTQHNSEGNLLRAVSQKQARRWGEYPRIWWPQPMASTCATPCTCKF